MHEGKPTFIARDKRWLVYGNDKLEKYVFGVPVHNRTQSWRGLGFYHMYTREGWSLLIAKLDKKLSSLEHEMELFLCCRCVCSEGSLTPYQQTQYQSKAKQCKELTDHINFAWAQFHSPGPGAALSPQLIAKYDLAEREHQPVSNGPAGVAAACGGFTNDYYVSHHHHALLGAAACAGGATNTRF